eukprot:3612322-Prymnesium_polylepis.1
MRSTSVRASSTPAERQSVPAFPRSHRSQAAANLVDRGAADGPDRSPEPTRCRAAPLQAHRR